MRYSIELDFEPSLNKDGEERSPEQIVKYLRLAVQQAATRADFLINKVDVKERKAGMGGTKSAPGSAGGQRGRKPVNRPKIEQWIRDNIEAGPSTQGTTGLNGVDKHGKPLIDSPNRIYMHRIAAPVEMGGVGLSMTAIDKVLKELDVEGYLERGFASGAPFYELIRPLEEDGLVGVRGRPLATPHEVDFTDNFDPEDDGTGSIF